MEIPALRPSYQEYMRRQFGSFPLRPSSPPGVVNVTTGSTVVLPNNRKRHYACLVNNSDQVIYLQIGIDAVLNTGIRLNAAIHGGAGNKVLTIVELEGK